MASRVVLFSAFSFSLRASFCLRISQITRRYRHNVSLYISHFRRSELRIEDSSPHRVEMNSEGLRCIISARCAIRNLRYYDFF